MPSVIRESGNETCVFWSGSRGRFRWKPSPACSYLVLENRANVVSRRTEWSSGKAPESPPGGCERQRDSPGYLQLLGMERRTRGAAAEPGRCQRGGSNDDLYPLLPVLLPTRDNTNHYHRLITGITANIEIMHACACVRVCGLCARERTCVHVLHKLTPRRVLLPPLFLLHHPLSSSPLLFSLADPPPRSIQRRHHPRAAAASAVAKSGASQRRTKRSVRRR